VFRFAIEEIPESGLVLTRTMDAAWAAPFCGAQFQVGDGGVRMDLALSRAGQSVAVRGRLTGALSCVCSRCAESAAFTLDAAFTHLFIEETGRPKVPTDVEDPEDLDVTLFTGAEIDLEPLVGEELALALPFVPLCTEGCLGLCQRCGKNLNEGPCACAPGEEDPRWEALRCIKLEGGHDADPEEEDVEVPSRHASRTPRQG
jgi:uncharacterized protein